MADLLNVDLNHVSDVELAKGNTSIMMAFALSNVWEMPLPELFTFDVESGP